VRSSSRAQGLTYWREHIRLPGGARGDVRDRQLARAAGSRYVFAKTGAAQRVGLVRIDMPNNFTVSCTTR
jgi:hypothetical protein